jgi:hypothetical protein
VRPFTIDLSRFDLSRWKLSPETRFLRLWFSDSALEWKSFHAVDFSFFDGSGNPIDLGSMGVSSVEDGPNERNGDLGWFALTLSLGAGADIPSHLNVRLSYLGGPMEHVREVAVTPNSRTRMSLEGWSELNGIGQSVDGSTFVAITVNATNMLSRRFDVVAIAKDGREIPHTSSGALGNRKTGLGGERFDFKLPLADIAKFRIGTRPIRTNEWRNVVLPGK